MHNGKFYDDFLSCTRKLYIIYFPERFSMSSSEIFIFLYAFYFLIWIRSFPRGVVLSMVKDWNCNFSNCFPPGTNSMIRLWKTIKYYTEFSSNNLFMVSFQFSIYKLYIPPNGLKWFFSYIPGRHIFTFYDSYRFHNMLITQLISDSGERWHFTKTAIFPATDAKRKA